MSPWYFLLIGIIVVVIAVVAWKWWKSSIVKSENVSENLSLVQAQDTGPPPSIDDSIPPAMLFVVNDQGNLDLTDFNGKLLDSSFGSTPKIYINLLDMVSKDVEEKGNQESGNNGFISLVGTTKLYEVVGNKYIVNFTRLT